MRHAKKGTPSSGIVPKPIMTEPQKTDHWASLASNLGAEPAPEEPKEAAGTGAPACGSRSSETPEAGPEGQPVQAAPPSAMRPAAKPARTPRRPAHAPAWDQLAGDLGIAPQPPPPQPAPQPAASATPPSAPPRTRSALSIATGRRRRTPCGHPRRRRPPWKRNQLPRPIRQLAPGAAAGLRGGRIAGAGLGGIGAVGDRAGVVRTARGPGHHGRDGR